MDLSSVGFNTVDVVMVGVLVLVATAAIWGIRKVLELIRDTVRDASY